MHVRLHRYWIHFERADVEHIRAERRMYIPFWGCGVTAYTVEDALKILRWRVFAGRPLPRITGIIEDIDLRTLDRHVFPNCLPPVWRGVWYPMGHSELQPPYRFTPPREPAYANSAHPAPEHHA